MTVRKMREEVVGELHNEKQELVRENKELVFENELIRRQNTMLLETLQAISEDESYWSQEAKDTGIVFRLKNVLKNIVEMR
jgi:hypothetical protein